MNREIAMDGLVARATLLLPTFSNAMQIRLKTVFHRQCIKPRDWRRLTSRILLQEKNHSTERRV